MKEIKLAPSILSQTSCRNSHLTDNSNREVQVVEQKAPTSPESDLLSKDTRNMYEALVEPDPSVFVFPLKPSSLSVKYNSFSQQPVETSIILDSDI